MVGNDVIDLRDRDSDPAHQSARFDERVFTAAERGVIADATDRVRVRWSMWAAKEASYKLARKQDPTIAFSPPRFEVTLSGPCEAPSRLAAVVRHPSQRFDVVIEQAEDWIHAVATRAGDAGAPAFYAVGRVSEEDDGAETGPAHAAPNRAARALARRTMAHHLGVEPEALSVSRRGRVPWLLREGDAERPLDLSLSHHGDYVAFASSVGPAPRPSTQRALN